MLKEERQKPAKIVIKSSQKTNKCYKILPNMYLKES